jgi:hypothetical protein
VVTTHRTVARLELTGASNPACLSVATAPPANQLAFTATAFDSVNNNITSTVGTITYVSTDTTVAKIDANGLVTAARPGRAMIFATVGGVNSPAVALTTCPPASIFIQTGLITPPETAFTLTAPATKQLGSTILDSTGRQFLIDIGLTWSSSNPGVATVSATGLVTAVGAGTARIVASCSPPGCNNGTNQPIYSNVVTATVTGTLAPRIYVTGASATTIVPIDPATNVPGTGVSIPQLSINGTPQRATLVNGMFSRDGSRLFLGSNLGLFTFDTGTNQFIASNTNVPGRVLAVAANGRVAVGDPGGAVRIYDPATATIVNGVPVTAPTAAAFTPDANKLVITGSAGVTTLSPSGPTTLATAQPPQDVLIIAQGSLAYVAREDSGSLTVHSTCNLGTPNNSILQNVAGFSNDPLFLAGSDDSSRVFALDSRTIHELNVSLQSTACPPTFTNILTSVNLGAGLFVPRQLIASPTGSRAFVLANLPSVLTYNADTDTPAVIPLAGGATSALSGGLLPDGSQLYVGVAGSNDVHRIDVASGTDAQQIAVNLRKSDNSAEQPTIVVVRQR